MQDPPVLVFDHIGVAVKSCEASRAVYAPLAILEQWTEPVTDETQRVTVVFARARGSRARVELVSPSAADSPVKDMLDRNRGFSRPYHLAYRTPCIERAVEFFRSRGAVPISEPSAASAFGGRPIAFLVLRDGLVVELIGSDD